MTRAEGLSGAYVLAIKLLSLRPRSGQELFRRLSARFGRDEACAVVGRLKKEGYVDDLSFARWWIEQRASFKPMGRRRLAQELLQHGVAPDVVREALAPFSADAELAAALEAARRQWRSPGGERTRERLALFLARRGFEYPVIDSVLRALQTQGGDFC